MLQQWPAPNSGKIFLAQKIACPIMLRSPVICYHGLDSGCHLSLLWTQTPFQFPSAPAVTHKITDLFIWEEEVKEEVGGWVGVACDYEKKRLFPAWKQNPWVEGVLRNAAMHAMLWEAPGSGNILETSKHSQRQTPGSHSQELTGSGCKQCANCWEHQGNSPPI